MYISRTFTNLMPRCFNARGWVAEHRGSRRSKVGRPACADPDRLPLATHSRSAFFRVLSTCYTPKDTAVRGSVRYPFSSSAIQITSVAMTSGRPYTSFQCRQLFLANPGQRRLTPTFGTVPSLFAPKCRGPRVFRADVLPNIWIVTLGLDWN